MYLINGYFILTTFENIWNTFDPLAPLIVYRLGTKMLACFFFVFISRCKCTTLFQGG